MIREFELTDSSVPVLDGRLHSPLQGRDRPVGKTSFSHLEWRER